MPLPPVIGTVGIRVGVDIAGIGRAEYSEAQTHQQQASQSHEYSSRVSPPCCIVTPSAPPEQDIGQKLCHTGRWNGQVRHQNGVACAGGPVHTVGRAMPAVVRARQHRRAPDPGAPPSTTRFLQLHRPSHSVVQERHPGPRGRSLVPLDLRSSHVQGCQVMGGTCVGSNRQQIRYCTCHSPGGMRKGERVPHS